MMKEKYIITKYNLYIYCTEWLLLYITVPRTTLLLAICQSRYCEKNPAVPALGSVMDKVQTSLNIKLSLGEGKSIRTKSWEEPHESPCLIFLPCTYSFLDPSQGEANLLSIMQSLHLWPSPYHVEFHTKFPQKEKLALNKPTLLRRSFVTCTRLTTCHLTNTLPGSGFKICLKTNAVFTTRRNLLHGVFSVNYSSWKRDHGNGQRAVFGEESGCYMVPQPHN